jgi:hypothetical protein
VAAMVFVLVRELTNQSSNPDLLIIIISFYYKEELPFFAFFSA